MINTPPVDFSVNLSDPTNPSSVQPTDFMVNGTPADSYIIFPPYLGIIFHFNTSPAVQVLNVMHIPAGAFNCSIGARRNSPYLHLPAIYAYTVHQLQHLHPDLHRSRGSAPRQLDAHRYVMKKKHLLNSDIGSRAREEFRCRVSWICRLECVWRFFAQLLCRLMQTSSRS